MLLRMLLLLMVLRVLLRVLLGVMLRVLLLGMLGMLLDRLMLMLLLRRVDWWVVGMSDRRWTVVRRHRSRIAVHHGGCRVVVSSRGVGQPVLIDGVVLHGVAAAGIDRIDGQQCWRQLLLLLLLLLRMGRWTVIGNVGDDSGRWHGFRTELNGSDVFHFDVVVGAGWTADGCGRRSGRTGIGRGDAAAVGLDGVLVQRRVVVTLQVSAGREPLVAGFTVVRLGTTRFRASAVIASASHCR